MDTRNRALATSKNLHIACLGTYPPRQCGIGTFTQDLCDGIAAELSAAEQCEVVALLDRPTGYDYADRVCFEIQQEDASSYRLAADFLNIRGVDVLVVQHEYGIYGGRDGRLLLSLLRRARMPVITVMHTVLPDPHPELKETTDRLIRLSDRIVVMAETAVSILQELYEVPGEKLVVIPHGVPDLAFVDPNFYKDQFGVAGRPVLLTFGLLSPGKGLEYAIEAMPELVAKHPDLVLLILGATHPKVKEAEGEAYRHKLQHLAEKRGVLDHVFFHDRYVTLRELCEYLAAADIYITPYLGENQIVSGTLSYAMAAGKAIVSTPYLYAREVLADGRGRLVDFRDSQGIAREVDWLLENEVERHAIRREAYLYSRQMVWREVARSYLKVCDKLLTQPSVSRRELAVASPDNASLSKAVPEIKLDHLQRLTDDTGMLQHARFAVPNREHGYCTDDNGRALVVALEAYALTRKPEMLDLAHTYLSFLLHAYQKESDRFRNFLSYDRQWLEDAGSEDCHARALLGLGVAVKLAPFETFRAGAVEMFQKGLKASLEFEHPRAWAVAIIGLHAYLDRYSGDTTARRVLEDFSQKLFDRYRKTAADDWVWPENCVSYANARLPHGLIVAGHWLGRDELIETGLKSLDWLLSIQTNDDGMLSPIGNNGWYVRGGNKARFDQQPIEAQALVEACVEAQNVTGDARWSIEARRCFDWFLGKNDLGVPLYDFQTGGCHDGLHPDRINLNQGAESTLACLLSLLAIRSLDTNHDSRQKRPQSDPAAVTARDVS